MSWLLREASEQNQRFRAVAASISIAAGILIRVLPEHWIERQLGVSPNGASGLLEFLLVAIPISESMVGDRRGGCDDRFDPALIHMRGTDGFLCLPYRSFLAAAAASTRVFRRQRHRTGENGGHQDRRAGRARISACHEQVGSRREGHDGEHSARRSG